MNTIDNHTAQTELINGTSVIIDVRELSEFSEHHIPGSLNFPSTTFNKDLYSAFHQLKICLVCESGSRAKNLGLKLQLSVFNNIYLLATQMQSVPKMKEESCLTIDRQFRMTLVVFLAIFLILALLGLKYSIIIPIILSTGLITTALINKCYMRIGIALLPWNKGKKIPE